jgi:mannan endo-1,4-beta-mannosidase
MKKACLILAFAMLVLAACGEVDVEERPAAAGFYVENGRLYDANHNDFIMRGMNHPHAWFPEQTDAIAAIKNTGANTVRVVLSSGDRWTKNEADDVANIIELCKTNRLICVLEVHDTTGYGEVNEAGTLAQATDYWLEMKDVLTGEEKYIIINIGNEPYGNEGYESWAADTQEAISRLRVAGFKHTIMVDAPTWGQDWKFIMRDSAADVFASDPQSNTVFSIHMYGVFDEASKIEEYLQAFVDAELPIIVGEFGHDHSDGDPDEDAILSLTNAMTIGYLGWSWSGNGGGVEYLDLVEGFDANKLTFWGERLINGSDGIQETSQAASVYRDSEEQE